MINTAFKLPRKYFTQNQLIKLRVVREQIDVYKKIQEIVEQPQTGDFKRIKVKNNSLA